ncbi:hypothetical protein [Sphingobacterium haloxyli]|uniref:Uncharacterized protein n=1 Tax=Sphingobacterium haloxyli TaxID=2100533 RepID=A0A2S9J8W1_9SPHI|nr:hypothetical protein [Sphingobacterium haloxyli]PRD49212.1 hypothetical protein C5745_00815 [Sphingobacterium haloxyli]
MTEVELTKEEKRILRKALISRVALLFGALLPVFIFSCYMLYLAVMSFVEDNSDMFSYIVPILFVLWCLGARKYILPQYRNLFKYGKAYKQIIETTVLDVRRSQTRGIPFFYITTDSGVVINTKSNVIFYMDVPALEIEEGMKLCLHMIPGTRNEILRVAAREPVK